MATCWISGLSVVRYPRSCLCRMKANFPSTFSLGSGLAASLKACDTLSRAALTDSDLLVLTDLEWIVSPLGWHAKGSKDSMFFVSGEVVEIPVRIDPNRMEVSFVAIPSESELCVGSLDHRSFSGWFYSREISQEDVLLLIGLILNPKGTWWGVEDKIKEVRVE